MRRIIILILVLLSFFSCRKEDSENPEGPYLNDLYGEFSVIEGISLSHENINFAQDNGLVISAELSKMTEWIIEIKGEVSGATRTINGFDRVISNDNAIWNGGANTFPAFGLEKAYISISFPNEPESPILMDSVIIDG